MKNYCAQIVDNVVAQIIVSDLEWATANLEGQWNDLGKNPDDVGVGYSYDPVTDTYTRPVPVPEPLPTAE